MNIIICGAGRVGYTIAKILTDQDHSVTVIDQSSEDIQKINDALDVKAIVGKATFPSILEKANAIRTQISSNIIYDTVDIVGENEITIKGTVGSVNQLNRYVTELSRSKHFQVIGDPKYITRGGKTTFTLRMFYQH